VTRRRLGWLAAGVVVVVIAAVAATAILRRSPSRPPAGGAPAPDAHTVPAPAAPPSGLRRLSVATFGAAGDGVQDDTAAIQRAVNAQQATTGAEVFLPAGTYRVRGLKAGPTDPPRDSDVALIVAGAGMDATTIRTTTGAIWGVPGGAVRVPELVVADLTLDGNYQGVTPRPGFPPGALDANPASSMVNLPYPGQAITAASQSYAGRLHQFLRVRFYRATGFVFQPTKAYITASIFDSDGQPDLPLTPTTTALVAPLAAGAPIDAVTVPRLDFRVWPGLRLVLDPGPHQQLLTLAAAAPAGDGPVTLAIRRGPVAAAAYPAGTPLRLARSHADTLGSGGTTALVTDDQFVDGAGNYADFVGSPTNPAHLDFEHNRSLRYRQGGLYGLGWYSRIVGNDLRNDVPGSGVGYDASSNAAWHGFNLVTGNTFVNLTLPPPTALRPGDQLTNNTVR
jgi:hypothetical protein